MKSRRQSTLLKLIEMYDISTQSELTERLSDAGFNATQATVSRDIKELRLVKAVGANGKSKYAVSHSTTDSGFSEKLLTIFRESVLSYDNAQNIVVLKTMPGLASAACSAIDSMQSSDIVGTLAGDDTAFLVMHTAESASDFCKSLSKMLS
ncbi:MAG: arginine repressor [Oscillospiraceae bacterium]|nr:arginine repressor [Oscillospiraceae bacterium]